MKMYVVWFAFVMGRVYCNYEKLSCPVDSSYSVDITIDYLQNDMAIVCNNNSLPAKSVENCVEWRKFSNVYVSDCFLSDDVIDSPIFNYAESLSLWGVYSSERFAFSKLLAKYLMLKMYNAKELAFDNLPFLVSLTVWNPNWEMSRSTFRNVPELNTLWSVNSRFTGINGSLFDRIPNLEILILTNNTLDEDGLKIFSGPNKLKILTMSESGLVLLPSDVFASLSHLKNLFLDRNNLSDLSPKLLSENRLLETLEISKNPLKNLPEELLRNCWKLRSFTASHCQLSSLPEKLFANCSILENVTLNDNRLTFISSETFSKTALVSLQLSGNALSQLSNQLFYPSNPLRYLNLSRNAFTRIPSSSYRKISSLRELDLHSNSIERVEDEDFVYLVNLKTLDLSRNKIRKFDVFRRSSNLLYLNLSANEIGEFPRLSSDVSNIKVIDLSYNNITYLSYSQLPRSGSVNLQYNQIASVSMDGSVSSNLSLRLNFNPLSCQCRLRKFVQNVQNGNLRVVDADRLVCHRKTEKRKLMKLDPLHLCPYRENCPRSCLCYLLEDDTVLVNCSSVRLRNFPDDLPIDTSVVHLENNNVSVAPSLGAPAWKSVTHLYLDGNRLDPWKEWEFPSGLKYLSLKNNKLTFLPDRLLKRVDAARSFALDIRNNNFTCNCSFRSFKIWFANNVKKILYPREVLCTRLLHHNNTKTVSVLVEVPVDAFCPTPDDSKMRAVIIGTTLAFFSLAVISSTVLYFRYKKLILAWLYSRCPSIFRFTVSDLDDDKEYDAFVSYSSSDGDCVMSLVNQLENKYPFFKLCIHERDWLPGYPIVSQIENSVKNSKKTLLILSNDFLKSFWCETELQMAYLQTLEDRIERIIVVIKGDLPPVNTLPVDIQTLLNTKTYLVWGERWFWEKLRYALPRYLPSKMSRKSRKMIRTVDGMINSFVLFDNKA